MTTIQTLLYSLILSLTEIFPVGSYFHIHFFKQLTGWTEISPLLTGAVYLGLALGLTFYFRHDFLSQISSILQVILLRRKPMTIDERLPFFMGAGLLIMALGIWQLPRLIELPTITLSILALNYALTSVFLKFSDSRNRRHKSMADWNLWDGVLQGFAQVIGFLPGVGGTQMGLIFASTRNFHREAAYKFSAYLLTTVFWYHAITALWPALQASTLFTQDLSAMNFGIAVGLSCILAVASVKSILKRLDRGNFEVYFNYRWFALIALPLLMWLKERWGIANL
jgi:undecaprenyl pyrophosphate phosphatase UppP